MTHAYLNGIHNKWRDKNITTYEQLKTYELGVRNEQEAKEKKPTRYQVIDQRKIDVNWCILTWPLS